MTQPGETRNTGEPSGIGGWLILPLLGLVVTIARGVVHLASYGDLFAGFDQFEGSLVALILFEFVGNIVFLVVLPIFLLVLAFRKSSGFPRWFVVWAGGGLAFVVFDLIAAQLLFGDLLTSTETSILDNETVRELFRSIVTAAIWIPYMRVSRRVANTFIN